MCCLELNQIIQADEIGGRSEFDSNTEKKLIWTHKKTRLKIWVLKTRCLI